MMKMRTFNDDELVRLSQNGNSDAFGELVLRYQSKMHRLARRMTQTEEDAEDVVQEAFVKAFQGITNFKRKSKFSTWLYRITVNHALMRLRRKEIDSVSLDEPDTSGEHGAPRKIPDTAPDPLMKLVEVESQKMLDKAIAGLRPAHQAVFVLRHVEELSTDETGRILDISTAAIKSRLHRARNALRDNLAAPIKTDGNVGQTDTVYTAA
jgi:RNA polymerase sigma-70 factor (ECF subfamily)